MLLQLNPPIPLVTPLGKGLAYMVIDDGPEFDLCWVVAQHAGGEIWTWPNPDVRAVENITQGRDYKERRMSPLTDPPGRRCGHGDVLREEAYQ
jgi:hypothetical protein